MFQSKGSEEKEVALESEGEPEKPSGLVYDVQIFMSGWWLSVNDLLLCDVREGVVEEPGKLQKNDKMKPKVRRHRKSRSDEPDLQESAFIKKIIAYQRKLLVRGPSLGPTVHSL